MAIVELKDVHKSYPLGKVEVQAVRGVSLSVNAGDFVTIAGPSGSGKSTILNMIGLVDRADTGEVYIDEQPVSGLKDSALTRLRHQRVGFIFQSFNLIPVLNVRENIEFPLLLDKTSMSVAEKNEWIDWLVEAVGLTDWVKHRSNELSGGQRQRVAIARALVCKPGIVLADEPTANLDSASGQQIIQLMQTVNRQLGTTFIFSTHDMKIVDIADHSVTLKDGQIVDERRTSASGAGRQ
jgi:putative ABC transport system ATP-binding protein